MTYGGLDLDPQPMRGRIARQMVTAALVATALVLLMREAKRRDDQAQEFSRWMGDLVDAPVTPASMLESVPGHLAPVAGGDKR